MAEDKYGMYIVTIITILALAALLILILHSRDAQTSAEKNAVGGAYAARNSGCHIYNEYCGDDDNCCGDLTCRYFSPNPPETIGTYACR